MTVREAATEVLAAELHEFGGCLDEWPCHSPCEEAMRLNAETLLDALAASMQVRDELVATYYAQEGRWYVAEGARNTEGKPIPGLRLWPLADLTLAAFGSTESESEKKL